MDTLQDKIVTTRKPHHCWGCTKLLPAKSEVQLVCCAEGGHISTAYWCETCREFLKTLKYYETMDGFDYGDLRNYDDYPKAG